ncbi:hypothetical protein [Polaromonas sp.]|nr:hypothetical protein [Polaromonas sp.]MDI1341398.1 hypothetical protein [Polaromonas sp.]
MEISFVVVKKGACLERHRQGPEDDSPIQALRLIAGINLKKREKL